MFLFFAKHETYNWRYGVIYQNGFKQLSIARPSNITFCDSLILMLFLFSLTGNLEPLPRIINWNFLGLGFIKLILNQFNKIFMSCCKSSKMISKTLSHLYIVLSSAKLHMFVLSRKRKRSLIDKLNNSRPKIDPCGMPLIMSYQSLYD